MIRHVAHVITKLDVGGAQTHVVELAMGQVAAGFDVDVVAGRDGPAADRLRAIDVPVRIVPQLGAAHRRVSQRAAIAAVTDALRDVAPQLVHGHSSHGGLAARVAARRLDLPSVYTAHGWPFQKGASLAQRVTSFAGEFIGGHLGDAVIVLSEAERRRALRAHIAPADRVFVVANGVSDIAPGLRRSASGVQRKRAPVMVMVARFAPPKMQRELMETLGDLADLRWTMRFVGDGPQLDECRAFAAASASLTNRVEFLGHRDDVAAILAGADIGILWSRYEGLPISLMECMRGGLCCVASDLPGTRELVGTSAGLLAVDEASLAVALRGLLADPERVDTLGASARLRYLERYSVEAMVRATCGVYREVTSS